MTSKEKLLLFIGMGVPDVRVAQSDFDVVLGGAGMSELIDRQALEHWIRTECASIDTYEDKEYVIERWRKELPTIDAVPVVLIENCIYTWEKQARRLGSGRERTCFEIMAETAKTILQIHAASQKIKMPTDGVKTVQFKKWKMFEEIDLTNPKPITEEDFA